MQATRKYFNNGRKRGEFIICLGFYAGVSVFSREMKDLVIPSYAHTPWARQAITERL